MSKASKNANKEYRLASWAIDNPTIIYVLIALFFTVGLASYFSMPREEFPEVIETKIYVSTVYPGNTAEDIERLVVDPLEDRIKNISNVTKFTSTSQEDYGMIMVEFEESVRLLRLRFVFRMRLILRRQVKIGPYLMERKWSLMFLT